MRNRLIRSSLSVVMLLLTARVGAVIIHQGEIEVNLGFLGDSMMRFHYDHGKFPRSFRQLGQSILCGGDARAQYVRPGKNAISVWYPEKCEFSYRLTNVSDDAYIIDAIDAHGRAIKSNKGKWPPPELVR